MLPITIRRTPMARTSNTSLLSLLACAVAMTLASCSKTAEEPPAPAPAAAAPAAETPPPANSESVARFTIGEFPALALSDGGFELPNDNKVFGVGKTPQ
jgi:hypothetical protein